jgi:acetyl-CoA synthetase
VVKAFVSLKNGYVPSPELRRELSAFARTRLGAVVAPKEIEFRPSLPKTRSGKIMRRLLRDIAEGRALGDTTTLADPAVVASLKQRYEDQEA